MSGIIANKFMNLTMGIEGLKFFIDDTLQTTVPNIVKSWLAIGISRFI